MMYEGLVRRLRNCATEDTACRTCDMLELSFCCDTLMKQAADAIESLSKAVLRLEDESGIYDELPTFYIYPTKWIPVTERLPTPRVKVLVAYKKGVTIAQMDGYVRTPQKEIHYWRGMNGPKHTFSSVTHWMPLPSTEGLNET